MNRFKTRRLVSVAVALATVAALCTTVFFVHAGMSQAASPSAVTASYNGQTLGGSKFATATKFLSKNIPSALRSAKQGPLAFKDHSPGGDEAQAAAQARSAAATNASKGRLPNLSSSNVSQGNVISNFNALSDLDQANANGGQGFEDTPPDQGVCVGYLTSQFGNQKIVLEIINSAARVFKTNGTPLTAPFSMTSAFLDANAFSDPRCFYDTQTNTFFLTVISFNAAGDTVDDVSVLNNSGQTTYQFDTAANNNCFGDQPHTGFDNNAVYVATDQFCGPNQDQYEGALLVAISKAQLVAQNASVNAVAFGPVSLGGIPILTLQPAVGTGTNSEYLLNSFPYDQFGNNNSIANTLGFWQVQGDKNITSGSGTVTLSGRIISSETYAFPVPAASTGTGADTCVTFLVAINCSTGILVTSEAFLDAGDSRMQQVQFINGKIYAAVGTALTIGKDPSARDGIAWFVVDASHHSVSKQGYIGAKGTYLMYPAFIHTHNGTSVISFSMTSATLNPSTAYVVQKSSSNSFGNIQVTGAGTGPHLSFADELDRPRWGDYSAMALDPNGLDLWGAAEYIPSAAHQDPIDNWGTRIWDVAGDH